MNLEIEKRLIEGKLKLLPAPPEDITRKIEEQESLVEEAQARKRKALVQKTYRRLIMEKTGNYINLTEDINFELIFVYIFRKALLSLVKEIENPKNPDVSWETPSWIFQREVDFNHKKQKAKSYDFDMNKFTDSENPDFKKLHDVFFDREETNFLRMITEDSIFEKKSGKYTALKPPSKDFEPLLIKTAFPIEKQKGFVFIRVNPLIIDRDTNKTYYPIEIGFKYKNEVPKTKKDRREFIQALERDFERFFKLFHLTPPGKFPTEELYFALPSHPVMFTLLALFAGKPERIPRRLFEKPISERTPEEQVEADKFLSSIFEEKTDYDYTPEGRKENKTLTAIVAHNPKVEARAGITGSLFAQDINYRETSLALYIKRTFGPEGLRHLLGLIIGLEDNCRKGGFTWNVNEHLERLGFKEFPNGGHNPKYKETAFEIVKIFTSLFITAQKTETVKGKERMVIRGERLFSIDGFDIEKLDNTLINESLKLRATDFWYKNAFEPQDGKTPQYTKLLRKIAQVNHREHPLTIFLTPLLSIFWRMNPDRKLSVTYLMDWCNLDYKTPAQGGDRHRKDRLKDLENELEYMKEHDFLGDWGNDGENKFPSECQEPFKCCLSFKPPAWLEQELKTISDKKEKYLLKGAKTERTDGQLSRKEFLGIFKKSSLSQSQFANRLGMSRQAINYIITGKQGRENPSQELSEKIRDKFPELYNEISNVST